MPAASTAGDTAVICVGESTDTDAAATDPKLTDAPDRKPEPVIVTTVPPTVEPVAGDTDDTTGTGAVNVKLSLGVSTDGPPDVDTTTCTVPAASTAGDTAVICVPEFTTTDAAATDPKLTNAPTVKLVPVIVTTVPPTVEPVAGLSWEMVGVLSATKVNRVASEVAETPVRFCTRTLTSPGSEAGATARISPWVMIVTLAASTSPKKTCEPSTKSVPVMVTGVPPVAGPVVSEIEETVGAAST